MWQGLGKPPWFVFLWLIVLSFGSPFRVVKNFLYFLWPFLWVKWACSLPPSSMSEFLAPLQFSACFKLERSMRQVFPQSLKIPLKRIIYNSGTEAWIKRATISIFLANSLDLRSGPIRLIINGQEARAGLGLVDCLYGATREIHKNPLTNLSLFQ